MTTPTVHPFYKSRKAKITADFTERLDLIRPLFAELLPEHPLDQLEERFLHELDQVLPFLPYAGGVDGRMTPFFEENAGVIGMARVLRAMDVPVATVGQLVRRAFLAKLSNMPEEERFALGQKFLSPENQAFLRLAASKSQERENPGDFVYDFVGPSAPGESPAFDFGVDYKECGFCKMCKASGDEDLLPHLCAVDQEFYALRGIKLFRTTTLAGGADRCNFRFRQNQED